MGYPYVRMTMISLIFDLFTWRYGRGLSLVEDIGRLGLYCEYWGIRGATRDTGEIGDSGSTWSITVIYLHHYRERVWFLYFSTLELMN